MSRKKKECHSVYVARGNVKLMHDMGLAQMKYGKEIGEGKRSNYEK